MPASFAPKTTQGAPPPKEPKPPRRSLFSKGKTAPPAVAPPKPQPPPKPVKAPEPVKPPEPELSPEEKKLRKRARRRKGGMIALVLVLAVAALALSANSLPGILFPHRDKYTILTVDYNAAGSDLVYLVSSGPRFTGSDSELRGAEYIASQFSAAGLKNVEILEYNITLYDVVSASLSLVPYLRGGLAPNPFDEPLEFQHKTDFTVQGYSGSITHNRWLDDLQVVDVGNGTDLTKYANAAGRAVIVTNDGAVSSTQLFIQAWEQGAAANIIHNVAMDGGIGNPAIAFSANGVDGKGHAVPLPDNYSGGGPDIPSIMVSKKAGDAIKDGIELNSRVRMDIQVTIGPRPCRVVVGDKIGCEQPNKIIMVGGHHDTVYISPGAVDNTAGTVNTIAIAREIGKLKPLKTIRFATFGGEEEGVLGSYEYFKANSEKLKGHLEAMLNLDMTNVYTKRGRTLPIVVNYKPWLKTLGEVKKEAYEKIPQLSGYDVSISQGVLNSSSDMATFALEGYRVGSCWGGGCLEYHTPKDTVQYITSESFLAVGGVYGSFALALAGGTK
jgi:aminopeptidase YwaD